MRLGSFLRQNSKFWKAVVRNYDVNDAGNLKKLVILKADQNQLLQLPTNIAQYVLVLLLLLSLLHCVPKHVHLFIFPITVKSYLMTFGVYE